MVPNLKYELSGGEFTLVSWEDSSLVMEHRWSISAGYAFSSKLKKYLHRIIAGAGPGEEVDHINGDRLDNRRSNLRLCTRAQNSANRAKRKGTSSIYKGVSWSKRDRCWEAHLKHNYIKINLGCFKCEADAARAYDAKAREIFGEFAKTNF